MTERLALNFAWFLSTSHEAVAALQLVFGVDDRERVIWRRTARICPALPLPDLFANERDGAAKHVEEWYVFVRTPQYSAAAGGSLAYPHPTVVCLKSV